MKIRTKKKEEEKKPQTVMKNVGFTIDCHFHTITM